MRARSSNEKYLESQREQFYSLSESEGGILPTVDSSSSESSGYADDLANSLGLLERTFSMAENHRMGDRLTNTNFSSTNARRERR